jgi:hypothetical protein
LEIVGGGRQLVVGRFVLGGVLLFFFFPDTGLINPSAFIVVAVMLGVFYTMSILVFASVFDLSNRRRARLLTLFMLVRGLLGLDEYNGMSTYLGYIRCRRTGDGANSINIFVNRDCRGWTALLKLAEIIHAYIRILSTYNQLIALRFRCFLSRLWLFKSQGSFHRAIGIR